MNRGGFSWKRLLGVTRVKQNISRKIGIPLSKSGRQQKIGRIITGGCAIAFITFTSTFVFLLTMIFLILR
jgi:hypothetical protein